MAKITFQTKAPSYTIKIAKGPTPMVPNVNPQKTAPSTVLQNPAKVATYQPAVGANKIQATATAQAIQNAAKAAQVRAIVAAQVAQAQAAAQAARVKEQLRVNTQGNIDKNKNANVLKISSQVGAVNWGGKIKLAKGAQKVKIVLPEQTGYDKAYARAYEKALALYNRERKPGKQNLLQKTWDKVSMGQDRRDVEARQYAEAQANKIMQTDFKAYEKKISSYVQQQAAAQAAVTAAALTMTQAQYDKFVAGKQAELEKVYNSLVAQSASYDAQYTAYNAAAKKPLGSTAARVVSKAYTGLKTVVSDKNPIWRSTLGSGWENVPSLVTAPGRAVNFVGNINTKDRNINQYGGTSVKRTETGKNAWQSTFNQRNWNLKPYVDKKFTKPEKEKLFGAEATKKAEQWAKLEGKKIGWTGSVKTGKPLKNPEYKDRNYWLNELANDYNRNHRFKNSALEISSDPLIGVGAAAKGAKFGSKAIGLTDKLASTKLVKSAAAAGKTFKTAVADNKVSKWLTSEHLTHNQRVQKAINEELDDIATKKPQVRKLVRLWQENKQSIKATVKGEEFMKVSDDFLNLSKTEVKVFQRYVRSGSNWANVKHSEKLDAAQKKVVESMAKKYRSVLDESQLKETKKAVMTPYRKNYLPQYQGKFSMSVSKAKRKLAGGGDGWWFTKEQKTQKIQSKKKLMNSLAARQYHSRIARQDLPVLKDIVGGSEDIRRNIERIDNMPNTIKKTKWEKFGDVASLPTKVWKKSVLLANPAWYTNNELFNQIQGVSAGGLKFIKNQRGTGKYLEHVKKNAGARMLPSQAKKYTSDIATSISKEVGTSKLTTFATKQENRSRIALYRTFRQKGLNHDEAVKKLDRKLFTYKTANWERPLKTVMPFWHWQKGLAKASVQMPLDNPKSAIAFNRTDRYQQSQYDAEFKTMVPELEKLGYTPEEIASFKEQNAKYFRGRLKIGNKWITTPFNAFSEKGMTNMGINPYFSAAREVADSVDSFGTPVSGSESSFKRRLLSKFPQLELGRQAWRSHQVDIGKLKPTINYIGKPGSEGYGMGKTKQGYDASKPNYVKSMDPRQKLKQNALAFVGVPRSFEFDKPGFLKSKKLQKVTAEYFSLDTSNMKWDDAEVARQELFAKYGMTPDDFYKGVLAKYDTENTTAIKDKKEVAKVANNLLFDEYGKQPVGTRSAWVVKKLQELNASGYYKDNPFLYSFAKTPQNPKGFITPDSVAKIKTGQAKKQAYEHAIRTGDWSGYAKKYGVKSEKARLVQQALKTGNWSAYEKKYGRTDKAKARDKALASGDWSGYAAKYGVTKKTTPHQYNGKYFKSADSMAKYKEGQFWQKYTDATKSERQQLLADNPQYNKRQNWTAQQWLDDKKLRKSELKKKAKQFGDISKFIESNIAQTNIKATKFKRTLKPRYKKVSWKLS